METPETKRDSPVANAGQGTTSNAEEAAAGGDSQEPDAQFFNFQQNDTGQPTYSNELTPSDDDSDEHDDTDFSRLQSSTLDSDQTEGGLSDTTCCVLCLCIFLALLLIGTGVGLNYGFMPPQKKHLHDAAYPECDPDTFFHEVKPKIAVPLSTSIRQMREAHKLENAGYAINEDWATVHQILRAVGDDAKELVLLYGDIERAKSTIQLFDQVEEASAEPVRVWFIDFLLVKANGTVHERVACLFERADEWERKHKGIRLLVVLDHISHYYQQEDGREDRGIVWNELESLIHWKQAPRWTLFVVESNPDMMTIQDMEYAEKIFRANAQAAAVCVPFAGGPLFKAVLTRLTSVEPDAISLALPNDTDSDAAWADMLSLMQYFSVSDAWSLYYHDIRVRAHEQRKTAGLPVELQWTEIRTMVEQFDKHFQDADIKQMEQFAATVGQAQCFDFHRQADDANVTESVVEVEQSTDGKDADEHGKKSKVQKRTMLWVSVIIGSIIVVLLLCWSFY